MPREQQQEVWAMLDKSHLAEVARKGPQPVFATISGAHLYGFASPDSDVDLRGVFMLSVTDMLGLHPPRETITIEDKTTIDLDWVDAAWGGAPPNSLRRGGVARAAPTNQG